MRNSKIFHRIGNCLAISCSNYSHFNAFVFAHDTVKQYANLITEKSGGHGAVREVCDFILKAQGKFDDAMKLYLD
jgi:3-deoxy-D-manno-octulosonate 8-phosphate phosphatase KdsC-like HAD superfamily phosphatase